MSEQELKQFITQAIKEAHSLGLESGAKETSGLVHEVLHRIEPAVEKSIEKYVNGKIRSLDKKIDDYIISDLKWKEVITPQIQMVQNLQGFGKVSMYVIGFLSAILGLVLLIINLWKT